MEYINFPIVALGAALVCLIGVTLYAIAQRGSLRSRDEQLVVARAQAYAMLELSQAGVLFLDREHKLMGEASAAAPELLGHTCGAGTLFDQVISDLVNTQVRRDVIVHLESLWKAAPTAVVDATQNPLARLHTGARHLAIRFSRLVVDGRVHHIIVSIERIAAPRLVPHTIEVPVLDEDTFAKRLAGQTGIRAGLTLETAAFDESLPAVPLVTMPSATVTAPSEPLPLPTMLTGEFELGPLDVTGDSLPSVKPHTQESMATMAVLAHIDIDAPIASPDKTERIRSLEISLPTHVPSGEPADSTLSSDPARHLATTITSPDAMHGDPAARSGLPHIDPAAIIEPRDPRLTEVLGEIMHIDTGRLEAFLSEARDRAGQLRAIIKLPAREPQAFREKLVLILELIRGIHARAERLPLPSVCDRAQRFEQALGKLRDKQTLSGNDFLPLAVKLDDLLSHLAIQGEVVTRLREWRIQNGSADAGTDDTPDMVPDATLRSTTATGTTIRQPQLRKADASSTRNSRTGSVTQKVARLSDLTRESLEEMSTFLADIYSKRVSVVVVGLEDVPRTYRRTVEKILGQLIHNAIRHGLETPADRVVLDKPEIGTVAVQFARVGADGYQLSVQDDGRGLDHDKIRAEAVRQGVLTAEVAAKIDPRKLSSLIFRPGFTTAGAGGARGIGMDTVRDLVQKAGGRLGIATKPGEYTRFRITLPYEKKASNAAVA
jgi:signal transduction histidine kinase